MYCFLIVPVQKQRKILVSTTEAPARRERNLRNRWTLLSGEEDSSLLKWKSEPERVRLKFASNRKASVVDSMRWRFSEDRKGEGSLFSVPWKVSCSFYSWVHNREDTRDKNKKITMIGNYDRRPASFSCCVNFVIAI